MIARLSDADKITFDEYRQEYGPHCDNEGREHRQFMRPVEEVLQPWAVAKSQFLGDLFGDKLILEKSVTYEKPMDQIEDEMYNTICHVFDDWVHSVLHSDWIWNTYHAELTDPDVDYDRFSDVRGDDKPHWDDFKQMFNYDSLSYNKWCGWRKRRIRIPIPGTKQHLVVDGDNTKMMKVYAKFAKITGTEEAFEKVRLIHSQVLNERKVEGKLCISIHPMDYVTMSDNCYNWDSCMSWTECEGYRAGTVEMMNSPHVVVAYLKGERDTHFHDGCSWNGKRWRQLFIVNADFLVAVKGYPYYNTDLTNATLYWLKDLVKKRFNWEYETEEIQVLEGKSRIEFAEGGQLAFCTHRMYNDFGAVPIHYLLSKDLDKTEKTFFLYSGIFSCMNCGALGSDNITDESHVFCETCEPGYSCACCGDPIHPNDDNTYWIQGERVCWRCYDRHSAVCAFDDDVYWEEDLREIYLAKEKDNPTEEDECVRVYFRYCSPNGLIRQTWMKKWFSEGVTSVHCKDGVYYLNREDLLPAGFSYIFGMYDEEEVDGYFDGALIFDNGILTTFN